jgi:microcystin-dependent protein
MGQILTADITTAITQVSGTQLQLASGTYATIGGQQYLNSTSLFLTIGTTGVGGIDTGSTAANTSYNIFAVQMSGTMGLVYSLSSTLPTGFTSAKLIGFTTTNATPNFSTWGFNQSIPSGTVHDYAGGQIQAGWLGCDGLSYPVASYPNLFGAIGYTYGGSGGSFNVPDSRGRASVGVGTGSGLTTRSLAATGGEENHALSGSEMPSHAHGPGTMFTQCNLAVGGSAIYQQLVSGSWTNSGANTHNANGALGAWGSASAGQSLGIGIGGNSDVPNSTGTGSGHNNMQPFIAFTKIIKI